MILSEEWRPIPGFERTYEVSSFGSVRRLNSKFRRAHLMALGWTGPARRRYQKVKLCQDGVQSVWLVHVLVMLAFVGPTPHGYEIDHLDNDPMNNRLDNLEYVTRSEQQKRAYRRDGRIASDRRGEKNACARLSWDDVTEIRRLASIGVRQADIARQYAVDPSNISHIVAGRLWRTA